MNHLETCPRCAALVGEDDEQRNLCPRCNLPLVTRAQRRALPLYVLFWCVLLSMLAIRWAGHQIAHLPPPIARALFG